MPPDPPQAGPPALLRSPSASQTKPPSLSQHALVLKQLPFLKENRDAAGQTEPGSRVGRSREKKKEMPVGRLHSPRGTARASTGWGSNNTPFLAPWVMLPASCSFQSPSGGGGSACGLSRRSQVQGGMNHSGAGWWPGDRPDAPLTSTNQHRVPLGQGAPPGASSRGRAQGWPLPNPAEWWGPWALLGLPWTWGFSAERQEEEEKSPITECVCVQECVL